MIFSCKTLTDKWGKQGEKIVYIGRKDESSCRKVENAAGALWGDLVILKTVRVIFIPFAAKGEVYWQW